MASANTDELFSDQDWGQSFFSKQYCTDIFKRMVDVDDVFQKFMDANVASECERKSLQKMEVVEEKFKYLMVIITKHCNKNDLQVLKSFIDALEATRNSVLAKQLSFAYEGKMEIIAYKNKLSEEIFIVKNLKHEIYRLEQELKQKERSLEKLKQEVNSLHKSENKDGCLRSENQKLEEEIKKKEQYIVQLKNEEEQLKIQKKELQTEVEQKTILISERETQIKQNESELQNAINESDRLRIEVHELKHKYESVAETEKTQLSKMIESLENKISGTETTIMNLRSNRTMTRAEIEDEMSKIIRNQERKSEKHDRKLDEQTAIMQQHDRKIDELDDKLDRILLYLQQNE